MLGCCGIGFVCIKTYYLDNLPSEISDVFALFSRSWLCLRVILLEYKLYDTYSVRCRFLHVVCSSLFMYYLLALTL